MTSQEGRHETLEQLESALLGGGRSYTRHEVAERAGVPLERAERLWRSLGFAGVDDDQAAFGDSDVEALQAIARLVDLGVVSPEAEASQARSLGQAMARLADWQTTMLTDHAEGLEDLPGSGGDMVAVARDLVPEVERLQSYIWRRHLVAAAGRLLPVAEGQPGSDTMVAGFADIVGFTRTSRSLSEAELARLVERFESTTASVIAGHGGRVVKTIGDEVLFVVRDPAAAAAIALELTAWVEGEDDLPQLRIGMAHGAVLARLGDVYGPVVNVASRLASVARPGTVLVDRALAGELEESGHRLKRVRRVSVRGYSHLEPWVLRASS